MFIYIYYIITFSIYLMSWVGWVGASAKQARMQAQTPELGESSDEALGQWSQPTPRSSLGLAYSGATYIDVAQEHIPVYPPHNLYRLVVCGCGSNDKTM